VSREITATLDLDKVMRAIVNASAALVTYDRAAIAILSRGQLRSGDLRGDGGGPDGRVGETTKSFWNGSSGAGRTSR